MSPRRRSGIVAHIDTVDFVPPSHSALLGLNRALAQSRLSDNALRASASARLQPLATACTGHYRSLRQRHFYGADHYLANTTVPVAWCAAISERSSPINFAMARLDVSSLVVTAVTRRSTRPEVESNTLIIKDPSGLAEHVQQRGWNPHSIMWRSSSVEIMTRVPRVG